MSAEVAEAIRQTRRTLAEKTWVPRTTDTDRNPYEVCLVTAAAEVQSDIAAFSWTLVLYEFVDAKYLDTWNDRQTDVGAVLGMTLQALIAEYCKPTLAPRTTEA